MQRPEKKQEDKKLGAMMIFVAVLGIIAVCLIIKNQKGGVTYQYCEEYVMTEELPSLMDFCYYSSDEWKEKIEEEKFGGVITIKMCKWLAQQTGTAEYVILPEGKEKQTVTRDEFHQVYEQFLDLLDEKQEIHIADEIILKQEGKNYITPNQTYLCDREFPFVQPMKSYEFYVRGENIIGIKSLRGVSSAVRNAYLLEESGEKIRFLYGGENYEISMEAWQAKGLEKQVCDLVWEEGELAKIQLKEERIQGNLIAVDDSRIQIEGYGEINRSANLPVYKIYGSVEEKNLSDIVIANMKVEYVVAEDRVEAILLVEPAQISRIRVLLLGEDSTPYRKEVALTCSTPYSVDFHSRQETKEQDTVVKGEELFSGTEENSIRFSPASEDGEFFLCNGEGKKISLGYRGVLELYRYPEGYTLISELSIEDYLCSVVPSEMPATYGMEALKAQAVCARSYVYIQMQKGAYAPLGAHVDDSTSYQVYNKQSREETTSNAVWDTAGEVLKYQGEIAEAYYFSTSSGVTGNGDSWALDSDPAYGYLHSIQLKDAQEAFDLSGEEAFGAYINSDGDSYDNFAPFYRWDAVCSFGDEEVLNKISGILAARKEKAPGTITFLDEKGEEAENPKEFGKLTGMAVQKRSTCGVMLELCLEYEKGRVILKNEYNIRAVLGAGCKSLTLKDGSVRDGVSLIPSAFAVISPSPEGEYHIRGGGYGHGIGMSQNGAGKMAELGKTYKEILQFFFQNVEILPVS
ncbi:MAG: SpoIID/LytB domain-containing protein [Lachnospiraceae bacterium]|nr:SpoIID/LytB domain-containing protein [Lachnospiraceae bacterium]